jgi:hypothetical protein
VKQRAGLAEVGVVSASPTAVLKHILKDFRPNALPLQKIAIDAPFR